MSKTERFCAGAPLDYAIEGVSELSSSERRRNNNLATPIAKSYGTTVDEETAGVAKRLYTAIDGRKLIEAVKAAGLDEVEDYDAILSGFDLGEDAEANLSTVMNELDKKITYGLAPREKDVGKVSKKKQRESVYLPHLITDVADSGGTVYMAKSLSTTAKVRMAWDLHDGNEVIVVDEYDKWANLLGWEKLKKFPHGKKQIREQYGDQLSDDVLDEIAGSSVNDTETKSDSDSSSRGRRTRTKPTDEILNVAFSTAHKSRSRHKAKDIKESFEDDGYIGAKFKPIKMLVLFPTTTDLNLSDHYWVGGSRWGAGSGKVAVANCNKGTFEYLNDCDEVWHIEDYLDQAADYEFETNHGPVTLGTIDDDNLVLHAVSEKTRPRLMRDVVIESIPEVLPEYANNQLYRSPEFPHSDDMLYAPITPEDVFWMRPALRKMQNPSDGDGLLLYSDNSPRDVGQSWSLSSDYKLYARARLSDWDFDSDEMELLDGCSYKIDIDDGGYELVETLAKLHDAGKKPFSDTPESRWSQ